jgi:hypothetical protein
MTTAYDQIQAGWSAHGRDGDKIGDIEEIGQNYLLVTKGLIFPKDLYVPMDVVQGVDDAEGRVILNVEKSQIDDMGWDEPPETGSAWSGTGTATSQDASSDTGWTEGSDQTLASQGAYGSRTDTDTEMSSDRMRVPVHEEQLRAERTRDQAGEVDKDVIGTDASYGSTTDASYADGTTIGSSYDHRDDDTSSRGRGGEVGGEAVGGGAGALGGAAVGGAVGGPPGAVIGGVVGAAGGALAGEKAEGGDEEGGSAAGGGGGALAGAAAGGAIAGPPGAVVGGAVGAGAGGAVGDKAQEDDDDDLTRR